MTRIHVSGGDCGNSYRNLHFEGVDISRALSFLFPFREPKLNVFNFFLYKHFICQIY